MRAVTPKALVDVLIRQSWTVAVAESCTGGMVGGAITSVPGSSGAFVGGVIAYSNELKQRLLDVPAAVLDRHGAVSGAAVEAMAHGVRERCQADVGVAVSGVAGPDGGTQARPVGTVWVAALGPGHIMTVHRYSFDGDRAEVRRQAVEAALGLLAVNLDEAVADLHAATPAG